MQEQLDESKEREDKREAEYTEREEKREAKQKARDQLVADERRQLLAQLEQQRNEQSALQAKLLALLEQNAKSK